jgi:isoquinoline 1-oxidoreductase beta subunit
MTVVRTTFDRRSFIKHSFLAGGGLMLGFSSLASCKLSPEEGLALPDEWFEINAYLKIGNNGVVTIYSPNPEFGSNVKTSMPMLVAEELDINWDRVIVEQAHFHPERYDRQFTGGSQGVRRGWDPLRMAGATARQMLREAAAESWQVPAAEITTEEGMLYHRNSGKEAGYGEMASAAAQIPVPEEVELKEPKDFKIIGTSRKNVDGLKMVTGKPLYGLDYYKEGTLTAMIVHPPAFGMQLKSFDDSVARSMPGIKDIFRFKTFLEDYERNFFDTNAFPELIAVVGNSTWEVWNAKNALNVEWEPFEEMTFNMAGRGGPREVKLPGGLESTSEHEAQMAALAAKPGREVRRDGNPEQAFKNAAKVIERSYTAPFLPHVSMEPHNFFAHVTEERAELAGPLQAPEFAEQAVAARLGMPLDKIDIHLTRMGGGFGRRAYGHYAVEAAVISRQVKAPVKLVYTREDGVTFGVFRPAYHMTYRAALDADNKLIGLHIRGGGVPESPLHANRFPAGAVDNYLAEDWSIPSNITVGAFRAPGSNFNAVAEQSFLDEVAEEAGRDPIEFRLELLKRAQEDPVGERNDYDAARYAGVLELVRDKSGWGEETPGAHRGAAVYFCHNSYVAQVLDTVMENGRPVVDRVSCAIDCGIVVNPDGATNMAEGAIIDGIGVAMYGRLSFNEGVPDKDNLDSYELIRTSDAPRKIDVHFVKNEIDPTGMGEPPFPPVMAALANSLYRATGKRLYHQPFIEHL